MDRPALTDNILYFVKWTGLLWLTTYCILYNGLACFDWHHTAFCKMDWPALKLEDWQDNQYQRFQDVTFETRKSAIWSIVRLHGCTPWPGNVWTVFGMFVTYTYTVHFVTQHRLLFLLSNDSSRTLTMICKSSCLTLCTDVLTTVSWWWHTWYCEVCLGAN